MKEVVKNILDRYQWVNRSRLVYWIQRFRQRGNIEPNFSDCRYKEELKTIQEQGCIVIPDFVDTQTAGKILEEVEQPLKDYHNNVPIKDYWKVNGGQERMGNIDAYSPTAKKYFYESDLIINLAKSYVSPNAVGFRKEADYKYTMGENYQANIAHIDDWRHRFKAFLLLHDVSDKNAPLLYYTKSHLKRNWRKSLEFNYHNKGPVGRYGHIFPQEMRVLEDKEGFEKVYVKGKAGTLFIGDFRGVHSGTPLIEGKRVMINYTWGLV